MTKERPFAASRLPAVSGERDYEVGYGKPPSQTRFKPGTSGNPSGRPKGSGNRRSTPTRYEERLKTIILQEAYRAVTVTDAKGPVTIPIAQAVIRALAVNAAKGNQRAQRLFTELLTSTERENRRLQDQLLDAAMTYKIEWDRELARQKAHGLSGPTPLPHPDHVVIDVRTGDVRIVGPASKQEQKQWDEWMSYAPVFEAELRELEAQLSAPVCRNRAAIEREISRTQTVLAFIKQQSSKR